MRTMGKAAEERRLRSKHVGGVLRKLRERAGQTQQELAAKLSYSSAQFISNWERGVALPPLEVLPRLSALWKVPPRVLVEAFYKYQEAVLRLEKKRLIAKLAKAPRRS